MVEPGPSERRLINCLRWGKSCGKKIIIVLYDDNCETQSIGGSGVGFSSAMQKAPGFVPIQYPTPSPVPSLDKTAGSCYGRASGVKIRLLWDPSRKDEQQQQHLRNLICLFASDKIFAQCIHSIIKIWVSVYFLHAQV